MVILKLKVWVDEKNKIVSTFNSLSGIMAISIAKKEKKKDRNASALGLFLNSTMDSEFND